LSERRSSITSDLDSVKIPVFKTMSESNDVQPDENKTVMMASYSMPEPADILCNNCRLSRLLDACGLKSLSLLANDGSLLNGTPSVLLARVRTMRFAVDFIGELDDSEPLRDIYAFEFVGTMIDVFQYVITCMENGHFAVRSGFLSTIKYFISRIRWNFQFEGTFLNYKKNLLVIFHGTEQGFYLLRFLESWRSPSLSWNQNCIELSELFATVLDSDIERRCDCISCCIRTQSLVICGLFLIDTMMKGLKPKNAKLRVKPIVHIWKRIYHLAYDSLL